MLPRLPVRSHLSAVLTAQAGADRCQLAPGVPHLVSGFCSPACALHADRSPRTFGLGFLQTPPRDDALALLLPSCLRAARKQVGSTITWHEDSHLARSGPCLAHTSELTGAPVTAHPVERLVMRNLFQPLFYVFVVS